MSGGPKFEYLWQDGVKFKKPAHLPANQVLLKIMADPNKIVMLYNHSLAQYITLLMDWIESQINDESIFPVTTDVPFPKTFQVLLNI
jgi:hypothetical protein